jgi:hypothetical protein
MAKVHVLDRWLTGSLVGLVALVFPLGCGGTPAGSPPSDNSVLGDSIVDSDGDGFSDDSEVNYIPRTDPLDATDTPDIIASVCPPSV